MLILIKTLFLPSLLLAIPSKAPKGVPVYLQPTLSIPTGHYTAKELASQQTNKQFIRWVRITDAEGRSGWQQESALYSAIDFSQTAYLNTNNAHGKKLQILTRGKKQFSLKAFEQRKSKIQQSKPSRITHSDRFMLKTDPKDPGRFLIKNSLPMYTKKSVKSSWVRLLKEEEWVQLLSLSGEWAKIKSEDHKFGFIKSTALYGRLHIADRIRTSTGTHTTLKNPLQHKVYQIFTSSLWRGVGAKSLPLYKKPNIQSEIVSILPPWSQAKALETREDIWLQSTLPKLGAVWWTPPEVTPPEPLQFQYMLRHPYTSAIYGIGNGVYKYLNNKRWQLVRRLYEPVYSAALAPDGTLFINHKYSIDGGKSFKEFINWKQVLETLKRKEVLPVEKLVVREMRFPTRKGSQEIVLSVDTGLELLSLYTPDRGRSWDLLKR